MSELKFSCPHCQQSIEATTEYAGLQINCPSCQTPMVVPSESEGPAPHGPRLSMAASTASHASPSASAAAAYYAVKTVKKKKSKTGLIAGLCLGACAIAAAIYFGPTLVKKFKHEDQPIAAADQAPANVPPPPPELSPEEILQKTADTYAGLTDYAAKAQTAANIDVPGKGSISINTTSSLQLGRTNNYRLEWEQNASGNTVKGAAWSAGKGDFVGYGPTRPSKAKSRQLALAPAEYPFLLLSSVIAQLFYSETNSLAAHIKDFDEAENQHHKMKDSYTLEGDANNQHVMLWINKKTFLINKIQVTLGGTVDQAELKKLPLAQRNALMNLSKLKGAVTETYDDIQINQNLPASAFETTYQPAGNPGGNPGGNPAEARPQRPTSRAGQLANPRRPRGGAGDAP